MTSPVQGAGPTPANPPALAAIAERPFAALETQAASGDPALA